MWNQFSKYLAIIVNLINDGVLWNIFSFRSDITLWPFCWTCSLWTCTSFLSNIANPKILLQYHKTPKYEKQCYCVEISNSECKGCRRVGVTGKFEIPTLGTCPLKTSSGVLFTKAYLQEIVNQPIFQWVRLLSIIQVLIFCLIILLTLSDCFIDPFNATVDWWALRRAFNYLHSVHTY